MPTAWGRVWHARSRFQPTGLPPTTTCPPPHPPPHSNPARQAFSSYLLIAWVSTNVIFVVLVTMFSSYTWEVRGAAGGEGGQGGREGREKGRGPVACWWLLPTVGRAAMFCSSRSSLPLPPTTTRTFPFSHPAQTCAVTETQRAISAIQTQAYDESKALAMADLIATAVRILQRGGGGLAAAPGCSAWLQHGGQLRQALALHAYIQ